MARHKNTVISPHNYKINNFKISVIAKDLRSGERQREGNQSEKLMKH